MTDPKHEARMRRLAEGIEQQLPGHSMLVLFYPREGSDLGVTIFSSHDEPGEVLRILRAVERTIMKEASGRERHFESVNHRAVITSAVLVKTGAHDRLRLWNRHGLAGELILVDGDGEQVALALGLAPKD